MVFKHAAVFTNSLYVVLSVFGTPSLYTWAPVVYVYSNEVTLELIYIHKGSPCIQADQVWTEWNQSRRTRTAAPNKHKLVASIPIDGMEYDSSELELSSSSHAVPMPSPSASAWSRLTTN